MAAQTTATPVGLGHPVIQQFLMEQASQPNQKMSILNPPPFEKTLQSFIESLNRGHCYIFKEENTRLLSPERAPTFSAEQLFHKCTLDSIALEYQKFDPNKDKIYVVADENSTDNYFDKVTYDRLQAKFKELGYQCQCQVYRQWPEELDIEVLYLEQKFHMV